MSAGYGAERPKKGKRAPFNERSTIPDKLPPNDLAAETALLGTMIFDWQVIDEVQEIIQSSESFYHQGNAVIYESILRLLDRVQAVDLVLLSRDLDDRKMLEQAGGEARLLEIAEGVPGGSAARHYARIVRDKWLARQLIETAGEMLASVYEDQTRPISELIDNAESQIFSIARSHIGQAGDVHLGDFLQDHYDTLAARDGEGVSGISTGFYDLDDLTSGLQKGDLIIIAGRPSMGKTALALCMAEHMAVKLSKPIGFFSMEMSRDQLANRLLCMSAGVDSHRLRTNRLTHDDFDVIAECVGVLADAPFYLDDTAGMSIVALRAKARRMASRHGLAAIFVDYLQLMTAPGSEGRQIEVSAISRGLKAIAREIDAPVICMSQLNRGAEARENHRPRMSDLRESGAIEQDADVIALMYREDYYSRDKDGYDPSNIAEILIEKQRQGPTGTVKLQWHGPTTKLSNLTTAADSGPTLY